MFTYVYITYIGFCVYLCLLMFTLFTFKLFPGQEKKRKGNVNM